MTHLLDIFIGVIFAVMILFCCYQGFLRSLFSLAGFFVAMLIAIVFSPLLARNISEIDLIEVTLFSYSEGAEMLDESDYELARIPVSQLSPEQIDRVVENGSYPYPIGRLLEKNLYERSFEGKGVTQLGDYISYTFLSFFCHTIAFILVFALAFAFVLVGIAVFDSALPFPVLRRFDGLFAGLVGLLISLLLGMVVMLMVPNVLFMVGKQLEFVQEMVSQSIFAGTFYHHNFLFWFIRGS